ncbi:hypothetical protein BKA67DRAFT_663195 [Truncatella angustata]|uniref:Ubiquitin-like protease family profile domain-containing protein n=1 Tax=Truncatella angustata TaxID=152316 RepID=A0A9P8RPA2_9PEZI|nr:uncharacterized protein BKA67DRAFT_663195 [Truncatella angustata]KAH6646811.1 hypothetical protein BKA67DRAFT_663195 [Truncatella angustata]
MPYSAKFRPETADAAGLGNRLERDVLTDNHFSDNQSRYEFQIQSEDISDDLQGSAVEMHNKLDGKLGNMELYRGNAHLEPVDKQDNDQEPTAGFAEEVESNSQSVPDEPRGIPKSEQTFSHDGLNVETDQISKTVIDPLLTMRCTAGNRRGGRESHDPPLALPYPISDPETDNQSVTSWGTHSSNALNKLTKAVRRNNQDSPSKYTATTLVNSSPRHTPAKGRATTEESVGNSAGEQPYWMLVTQSDVDFASESLEQIEGFDMAENTPETYKDVLTSWRKGQDNTTYSDGSEWRDLMEASYKGRYKSSILYAMTAIAFCRWHEHQAQLESQRSGDSLKSAKITVTARILSASAPDQLASSRDRQRRSLNIHLTRGRKWSQLIEELSLGILFKYTWALGKADKSSLQELIFSLKNSPAKLSVLKFLETQLEMFLSRGRTDPDALKQALKDENLLHCSPQSFDISVEVNRLQTAMRKSSPVGRLHILGSTWGFYIDELARLNPSQWFGEDLVQLCIHLADRLPHVRVGFPVAIHDRHTGKPLVDPLKWVKKRIEKWNAEQAEGHLTCFFPLFLQNDHFTLLEINQTDDSVSHYDTAKYNSRPVKAACKAQFPHLRYMDQQTLNQDDNSSCGPLVVAIARRRMMSRSIESLIRHDAKQLRFDALSLIRRAWDSKILIPEPGDDYKAEDDVTMSTELLCIPSPERMKDMDSGEKHIEFVDQKSQKRKRVTRSMTCEMPVTRSKARKIS